MKTSRFITLVALFPLLMMFGLSATAPAQPSTNETPLDQKVRAFLDRHRGTWTDLNIPAADGKILYDLIVKNHYKSALEIGTSTGHSAVWIAWALSKTGGKLITIEIDPQRHRRAVANFKEAGLQDFIDARLADAHELVRELKGPFEFVFCDADKEWYKNYFVDIYPKLKPGGTYAAHNVTGRERPWMSGTEEFYDYVRSLSDMTTTLDLSGSGMSISRKVSE